MTNKKNSSKKEIKIINDKKRQNDIEYTPEKELYVIERENAIKRIKIADHMLSVTYQTLNEPKILIGVLENIFLALTCSISSILYLERKYKEVPPFRDNFDSKYRIFKTYTAKKFKIDNEIIRIIKEVKDIIEAHHKSPIEFSKEGNFIICSSNYDIKKINVNELKHYINKAKVFIHDINSIIFKHESRNSRIFRRN